MELIYNRKQISPEESIELVKRAKNGDKKVIEELVEGYSKIIWFLVKKYYFKSISKEDLYQEGVLGLLESIDKYDETKGASFTTFTYFYIQRNISRYVRSITHQNQKDDIILKKEKELRLKLNRRPTDEELACAANISIEKVNKARNLRKKEEHLETLLFYNNYVYEQGYKYGELHIKKDLNYTYNDLDYLKDKSTCSNKLIVKEVSGIIKEEVSKLSDKERDIIFSHLGIGKKKEKYEEIGKRYNISSLTAHRTFKKCMDKLRNELMIKGYDESILGEFI